MKQKIFNLQLLLAAVVCVIMSLGFTGCSDDDDKSPENAIVGTWRLSLYEEEEDSYWYCQYEFRSDGTLSVKDWNEDSGEPASYEATGKWTIANDRLVIEIVEEDAEPYRESYRFSIDGDKLTIYDYDEDGPNVFVKVKK